MLFRSGNTKLKQLSRNMYFEDSKFKPLHNILADEQHIAVGHNISFDLRMIKSNMQRHTNTDTEWKKSICTMDASKDICKIAGRGKDSWKKPKLCEAIAHLKTIGVYNNENAERLCKALWGNEGAYHDARFDVVCTMLLFQYLYNKKLIKI